MAKNVVTWVAGPDDTVIISFSGHGTHDHRLVAHDTAAADLPGTTIPTHEIVSGLRQSSASAVLCVLDCCFSGGAPARVLEDSLIPRDAVSGNKVLRLLPSELLDTQHLNVIFSELR